MPSDRVTELRIRHLMGANGIGVGISVVNMAVVLWLLHNDVDAGTLALWAAFLVGSLLYRLVLYRLYSMTPARFSSRRWEGLQVVGVGWTGVVWGAVFLFVPEDLARSEVLVIMLLLVGTAAGAAFSTHASRPVAAVLIVGVLGVSTGTFVVRQYETLLWSYSILAVAFTVFLLYYAFRFNRLLVRQLELQEGHAVLLTRLQEERHQLEAEIAERQRKEEALEEAHKNALKAVAAKDLFLSSISHELRTPLNAVMGFVDLVLDVWPDPLTERQTKALEAVQQSSRHLFGLVGDVLDYSSSVRGEMRIDRQPVSLQDVLPGCLLSLHPLAERAGVRLPDPDGQFPGMILADPQRLRQVLLNVLGNAIKYNHPGGSVRVHITAEPDLLRVAVEDSGVGIPEAQRGKLFEPFNRLGREASSIEGTGLGLALSRQLMDLMGGTLTYRPAEGQGGSVFVLTLPRLLEHHLPDPAVLI